MLHKETKEHCLEKFAQHIFTQSQKDAKEKRELKHVINMMVEYIDSLDGCGILPLVQDS